MGRGALRNAGPESQEAGPVANERACPAVLPTGLATGGLLRRKQEHPGPYTRSPKPCTKTLNPYPFILNPKP